MGGTEFLPVFIIAAKAQHYQHRVQIECEGEWKESLQMRLTHLGKGIEGEAIHLVVYQAISGDTWR